MGGFDIEEFLNIDNLRDTPSIDEKLNQLRAMRQYANDWTARVKSTIDILEERKRSLEESG